MKNLFAIIKNIIIEDVLKALSKEMREYIEDKMPELEKRAKASKNPYDDMLVELLKNILAKQDKKGK
jgi:hypothetical protein